MTFAHNGKLPEIDREPLTSFLPIGGTDSEHAFCLLLNGVREFLMQDGGIADIDLVLNQIAQKATSGAANKGAWKAQQKEAEAFRIRKAEAAANAARIEAEKDMFWECS